MVSSKRKSWAGNIEAIKCAYVLKDFFIRIDSLKKQIFYPVARRLPYSYIGAYEQVQAILDGLISDLSSPYTKTSLRVDERAAAIFKFESDLLSKYLKRISSNSRKVLKWLKIGFRSANIIIGSLQTLFPPLNYIREFKEQIEFLVPDTKSVTRNPMIARRSNEKIVPRPKRSRMSIIR